MLQLTLRVYRARRPRVRAGLGRGGSHERDLPQLARHQERLAGGMWQVFASGSSPMHLIAAR